MQEIELELPIQIIGMKVSLYRASDSMIAAHIYRVPTQGRAIYNMLCESHGFTRSNPFSLSHLLLTLKSFNLLAPEFFFQSIRQRYTMIGSFCLPTHRRGSRRNFFPSYFRLEIMAKWSLLVVLGAKSIFINPDICVV